MIKTNAMKCYAVWITDMGYEKRRYKKIGGLRNVHMNSIRRRMEKINRTKHNNKLRSAGNDWVRRSPDTDTKKETKEMEPRRRQRIWNGQRLLFLQEFLLHFT